MCRTATVYTSNKLQSVVTDLTHTRRFPYQDIISKIWSSNTAANQLKTKNNQGDASAEPKSKP